MRRIRSRRTRPGPERLRCRRAAPRGEGVADRGQSAARPRSAFVRPVRSNRRRGLSQVAGPPYRRKRRRSRPARLGKGGALSSSLGLLAGPPPARPRPGIGIGSALPARAGAGPPSCFCGSRPPAARGSLLLPGTGRALHSEKEAKATLLQRSVAPGARQQKNPRRSRLGGNHKNTPPRGIGERGAARGGKLSQASPGPGSLPPPRCLVCSFVAGRFRGGPFAAGGAACGPRNLCSFVVATVGVVAACRHYARAAGSGPPSAAR